mmetsp:Transcript_34296/g.84382  ORF Transcript_34296/g.84382 Transcript_34296/m.84382 type:complete len:222 (-) Transcript_34296:828-1493(-)
MLATVINGTPASRDTVCPAESGQEEQLLRQNSVRRQACGSVALEPIKQGLETVRSLMDTVMKIILDVINVVLYTMQMMGPALSGRGRQGGPQPEHHVLVQATHRRHDGGHQGRGDPRVPHDLRVLTHRPDPQGGPQGHLRRGGLGRQRDLEGLHASVPHHRGRPAPPRQHLHRLPRGPPGLPRRVRRGRRHTGPHRQLQGIQGQRRGNPHTPPPTPLLFCF